MTEIIIDSKEPFEYKIKALASGDIAFTVEGKQVLIERKTWADLFSSQSTGRLAIQLNQLRGNCDIPMLAIIGYPHDYNELRRKNLLLAIQLAGIVYFTCNTQAALEARLKEIYDFLLKEHTSLLPYRYTNPKLAALMFVAGIGYKTANRMLDTWQGSLIDIYTAPKQALAKIIGDRLADRFYQAIRKPVKQATKADYDLFE